MEVLFKKESKISIKNIAKFVGSSMLGVIMFLIPVSSGEGFNTVIGGIIFNLIPTVITWGTLVLILVEYTPILYGINKLTKK